MQKLRAKFTVQSVNETTFAHGKSYKVMLYPVTGGSPEDDSFFKATPAGHIELDLVRKETAEAMKPGKTYYVDFMPADE